MKNKYFYHQISNDPKKEFEVIKSVFDDGGIYSRKFLEIIKGKGFIDKTRSRNANGYEYVSVCSPVSDKECMKYSRQTFNVSYNSYILGEGYQFKPLSFIIDGNIFATKCEYIADAYEEYEYYLKEFPERHFSTFADEYHVFQKVSSCDIMKIGFPSDNMDIKRLEKLKQCLIDNKIDIPVVDVRNPEKIIKL